MSESNDPLFLASEADLRERCRRWLVGTAVGECRCMPGCGQMHLDQLITGILAGPHPAWGSDWSAWWSETEDYRHGLLRFGTRLVSAAEHHGWEVDA